MRGTDDLEARLRRGADGFPGVAPSPSKLDAVVARGRRGRTMARAAQLGAAASLVTGVAFAAPAILDRAPSTPEVATHIDEEVESPASTTTIVDVTSPWDGVVVDDPSVTFSGTAEVGARVTVEGFDVDVAPDGRWQITLEVDEGEHRVEFRGVARDGRVGRDAVTVTYLAPVAVGDLEPTEEASEEPKDEVVKEPAPAPVKTQEPAPAPKPKETVAPAPAPKETAKAEPKPEPAPAVAFTANQKYGSCEEQVPYDEFWGTAKAGTEVWVWSEYGQKTVPVNGNGEWFARVEFPEAPQGVPFDVKTKSLHTGEKIYWKFTNNGPGGTPAEATPVEWSVWQHNSEVEYDPPYNYYEGTATKGTVIHVVSEYGSAETVADANGHWKTKVWFESAPPGSNTWQVVVESSAGDRNVFEFTGVRPEAGPQVAFTSDQVHDVTDDTPPHSRYVGTAQPETKVWIYSEYGETYVHANAEGNFDVWAEFPTAPRGQTIAVKVKSLHTGEAHWYELQVM